MGRRSWWFLLTGLILGALAGAGYAWLADPVRYVEMAPSSLPAALKDEYRALIAASYTATGDLPRARARLNLLQDPDPQQALAAQAQRIVAARGSFETARALALLAVALNPQELAGTPAFPPAPAASPPASLPGASSTPAGLPAAGAALTTSPEQSPTPTPGPSYAAAGSSRTCDPALPPGLLQVRVLDSAGKPVPGVQVIVTWDDGQDAFYTGLKPEEGAGYADFQMVEGQTYTVNLAQGGEPVKGISAGVCSAGGGGTYPGGWEVLFQQP